MSPRSSFQERQPLPGTPYLYAEWKQRRAGLDYHVEVAKHYYSVPHALAKQKLWARITDRSVEVFHKDKRVAAHMRASGNRHAGRIARGPFGGGPSHRPNAPCLLRREVNDAPVPRLLLKLGEER